MNARATCHDCAFRKDSPEQGREMVQITASLEGAVKRGNTFAPFYCHQGMPIENGEYVPEVNKRGVPVAAPLCMGWVQALDRMQRDAKNGAVF